MIRTACLILTVPLLLAGCGGEPDQSRFTPATESASKPSPVNRGPDANLPPDMTKTIKIPMH